MRMPYGVPPLVGRALSHRRLSDTERVRCLGKAALIDHGHEGPQQFSRDVQHAPSPFLCCRMLVAIRSKPKFFKPEFFDCPLRPVPITCNVCSIPPKSSAAINVVGACKIGKYCVGIAPVCPSRGHTDHRVHGLRVLRSNISARWPSPPGVAPAGHWLRVEFPVHRDPPVPMSAA